VYGDPVTTEEDELRDRAEQAIEQALLSLFLSTDESKPMTAAVGPDEVRSRIEPVLKPMLLSVGWIMQRGSKRRQDTSSWGAALGKTLDTVVPRIVDALDRAMPGLDAYKRDPSGPESAVVWARRLATAAVTTATEDFKERLSNRMGFETKSWVTREDSKVRATHQRMHGQTVPRIAMFTSPSGAQLDRPGDQTAPIEEWAQCRCRVLYSK
jgi:hypothetical protein